MENKIKIGDVVRLKSGGPKMTVKSDKVHYAGAIKPGIVECQWFTGNEVKEGEFPLASLEKETEGEDIAMFDDGTVPFTY